jgi:endonuclease YncB( thermonuclease family)
LFSTKAPNEKARRAASSRRRLLFAALIAIASGPALAQDVCRVGAGEAVAVATVDVRLELTLADGRVVRIAGLEPPPDAALGALAAHDLQAWTADAPLSLAIRRPMDRWGRATGRVFLGGDLPSLAIAAIEAGFARVDPLSEDRPCLDELYRAEERARRASRGLWRLPVHAVLKGEALEADGAPALAARSGEWALVEGLVAGIGSGRVRTFINLTPDRRGAALVLSRDAIKAFARAGVVPAALVGRRVRARGLLDTRLGLRLEVATPGALEILP